MNSPGSSGVTMIDDLFDGGSQFPQDRYQQDRQDRFPQDRYQQSPQVSYVDTNPRTTSRWILATDDEPNNIYMTENEVPMEPIGSHDANHDVNHDVNHDANHCIVSLSHVSNCQFCSSIYANMNGRYSCETYQTVIFILVVICIFLLLRK